MEDYEKLYKDVLAKAREIHRNENEKRSDMEWLFPELKESVDEKIRKDCISIINAWADACRVEGDCCEVAPICIAWLEKQGDNNNQNWKPSKGQINALEHFVRSIGESGYGSPYDDNTNLLNSLINDLYKLEKQGEQKPTDKVEPIFSIGDVLCDKSCTTLNKKYQPIIEILDIRDGMYICNNCSFPISQQYEYELVTKKNEPQYAWSDEDEHRVEDTIYFLDTAKKHYACTIELDACIDWLKSLKERKENSYDTRRLLLL